MSRVIVREGQRGKHTKSVSDIEVGTIFWGILDYGVQTRGLYFKTRSTDKGKFFLLDILQPKYCYDGDVGSIYDYEEVDIHIETKPVL